MQGMQSNKNGENKGKPNTRNQCHPPLIDYPTDPLMRPTHTNRSRRPGESRMIKSFYFSGLAFLRGVASASLSTPDGARSGRTGQIGAKDIEMHVYQHVGIQCELCLFWLVSSKSEQRDRAARWRIERQMQARKGTHIRRLPPGSVVTLTNLI